MSTIHRPPTLQLAASAGVLSHQLAALLAQQRTEEPETPILLSEVSPDKLFDGLKEGRFDIGITWATAVAPAFDAQPLWCDEFAVAVPLRSPLLAHATIMMEDLAHYPLLHWSPQLCETLTQKIASLTQHFDCAPRVTTSFELMTVLVAAGYGVGLAPRSRIERARDWGIIMRRFAEQPLWVRTSLVRTTGCCVPAIERFARRARVIAGAN